MYGYEYVYVYGESGTAKRNNGPGDFAGVLVETLAKDPYTMLGEGRRGHGPTRGLLSRPASTEFRLRAC